MRVRCVKCFRDLEEGTYRNVGDTFEVSEERFNAINSTPYGVLTEEVEEPKAKPKQTKEDAEEKPKRRYTRRKTAQEQN